MNAGIVIGGSHVYDANQRLENRIDHAIESVVHRPAEGVQYIDRVEVRSMGARILVSVKNSDGGWFQNTTTDRLAAARYIKAAVLAGREPEIPEELG
jgi:hypothetical protein